MADFAFAHHGSVTVLVPLNDTAREWIDENVAQTEETQWFGKGLVIEPRYADPVLDGIAEAGLTVST